MDDDKPRPSLRRHAWRSLSLAGILYALFVFASWYTTRSLPEGEAYVLTARGGSALLNFLLWGVAFALFAALYTLPAFVVRRSIGCMLRGLMFVVFVFGVGLLQAERCVAVVRTPASFLFVRRVPFGHTEVPNARLPEVEVEQLRLSRRLTLSLGGGQYIHCEPVWNADERTCGVLDRLVDALRQARATAREGSP